MIINILQSFADKFIAGIDRFSKSKLWLVKSTLIIAVVALFFTFPDLPSVNGKMERYDPVNHLMVPTGKGMVQKQIDNPLMVIPSYNGLHVEKVQFRLTMPVIGHFLHLNVFGLIALQQIAGIFFLSLLILLLTDVTHDRVTSILLTAGFGFTYVGIACFTDLAPWFDGIAYFLLAAAMYSRKPVLIGLFILLAAFVDERALIASPLIFIWWKIISNNGTSFNFKQLFKPDKFSISIILAWIAYVAMRYFLTKHYGFETHAGKITGSDSALKHAWRYFAFGALTGIEWLWLFIIAGFLQLFVKKQYLTLLSLLVMTGVISVTAAAVYDVTKSMAYIFPMVIICLYILIKEGENIRNIRYISIFIMLLCLILPTFQITGMMPYMIPSSFFVLMEKFLA